MKNYTIIRGENKYSAFSGTQLIAQMFKNLNLEEKIHSIFKSPLSNRAYKPLAYIKSIVAGLLTGADCISDINHIKDDDALKHIWEIETIPHNSRIGSFLAKQDIRQIDGTHSLLQNIAINTVKKSNLKEITFDPDATFIETGKQNLSKKCYKGFKALQILYGFIAETQGCIYSEFRDGNISPASGLYKQLINVDKLLLRNGIKLKNYRADAASYQANIINYCKNKIFFIRAKNYGIDYSVIDKWKPLLDRCGTKIDDYEIGETVHAMENTEPFRLVVARKKKGYDDPNLFGEYYYEYYAIATNSDLSPNEVYNFYNLRGTCEYYIKTMKWDYSLRKLPTGSFNANAIWVNIAGLVYNVMKHFCLITGINRNLKSLRFLLFNTVGRIVNHSGRLLLKLYLSKKEFQNYNDILFAIQKL